MDTETLRRLPLLIASCGLAVVSLCTSPFAAPRRDDGRVDGVTIASCVGLPIPAWASWDTLGIVGVLLSLSILWASGRLLEALRPSPALRGLSIWLRLTFLLHLPWLIANAALLAMPRGDATACVALLLPPVSAVLVVVRGRRTMRAAAARGDVTAPGDGVIDAWVLLAGAAGVTAVVIWFVQLLMLSGGC